MICGITRFFFVFRINDTVYEVEKSYSKKDYKYLQNLYDALEVKGTEIILEYILNQGFTHVVKDVLQDNFKKHIDNETYKRFIKD